jgi:ribonuclease HII
VVAAAIVLPRSLPARLFEVRDSKRLSGPAREGLLDDILATALGIGIGWSSHHVIDRLGIAGANRIAMMRAIDNLAIAPDALLIDAVHLPCVGLPQICLPKGESYSLSIAAASVVAKVVRDRWMIKAARRFPAYGFERNKGYGTAEHRDVLLRHGPCALHRRSFRPVADFAP